MIRILRFLFTGDWHLHKWETVEKVNVVRWEDSTNVGAKYNCRCEICGRWKHFNCF